MKFACQVENLTEGQHRFLAEVVAIMTDPARQRAASAVQAGNCLLCYDPANGCVLVPIFHDSSTHNN